VSCESSQFTNISAQESDSGTKHPSVAGLVETSIDSFTESIITDDSGYESSFEWEHEQLLEALKKSGISDEQAFPGSFSVVEDKKSEPKPKPEKEKKEMKKGLVLPKVGKEDKTKLTEIFGELNFGDDKIVPHPTMASVRLILGDRLNKRMLRSHRHVIDGWGCSRFAGKTRSVQLTCVTHADQDRIKRHKQKCTKSGAFICHHDPLICDCEGHKIGDSAFVMEDVVYHLSKDEVAALILKYGAVYALYHYVEHGDYVWETDERVKMVREKGQLITEISGMKYYHHQYPDFLTSPTTVIVNGQRYLLSPKVHEHFETYAAVQFCLDPVNGEVEDMHKISTWDFFTKRFYEEGSVLVSESLPSLQIKRLARGIGATLLASAATIGSIFINSETVGKKTKYTATGVLAMTASIAGLYVKSVALEGLKATPFGYINGPAAWNAKSGVLDYRVATHLMDTEGRYKNRHHMLVNTKIVSSMKRYGYGSVVALENAKKYSRFILEREAAELSHYEEGDFQVQIRQMKQMVKTAIIMGGTAALLAVGVDSWRQGKPMIQNKVIPYIVDKLPRVQKLGFEQSLVGAGFALAGTLCETHKFEEVIHTKCAFRPVPKPKIDEDWTYKVLSACPCPGSRKVQVCGPIVNPDDVMIPHHCNDAAERALLHRQAKAHEPYDEAFVLKAIETFEKEYLPLIFPKASVELMTEDEWLYDNHWPKSKRDANVMAMHEFIRHLRTKDYMKESFIKEEVGVYNPYSAKPMRERFIQGNKHAYNVAIAPAIKSCATAMKKIWDGTGPIHYACRSNEEMGDIAYENVCNGLTWCSESDFVAFDSHQHVLLLQLEARIYDYMLADFPDKKRVIAWLKKQEQTHGIISCRETEGAIEYWGMGTRASGMPNTSCGNTLLNVFAQLTVLTLGSSVNQVKEWLLNKSFALHLLGDDMWFQGTKEVYQAQRRGWVAFKKIGLPATGNFLGEELYGCEFLRRRPYDGISRTGEETFVLMPRPGRILQRAFVRYAGRVLNEHDAHYYAHVVATGLKQQFVNTPVITKLLDKIIRLSGDVVDSYPRKGCYSRAKGSINRHLEKRIAYWGSCARLSDTGVDQFIANYCLTDRDIFLAEQEIEKMTTIQTCLGGAAFHKFHEIDNHA
jgi:hypothetical protein